MKLPARTVFSFQDFDGGKVPFNILLTFERDVNMPRKKVFEMIVDTVRKAYFPDEKKD